MTHPPAWTPSAERIDRATITQFAAWAQERTGLGLTESYDQLWRWSVQEIAGFWSAVWEYFDVQADGSSDPVLADSAMPGARWFPHARLNYAEHLFRDRDQETVAIRFASERDLAVGSWTWARLEDETARVATGLRALGVRRGDRVAGYLTNSPETVAAFLACASLGAIWTAGAPEFGVRTIVDRFAQIEPKVLLAVDGYRYGGKDFDRRDVIVELRAALPTVEHLVVLEQLGAGSVPDTVAWEELTAEHTPLQFSRVIFDHPLWILFSSGTTGLPKPIVHGHGGVLLEHLKVMNLHVDARPGDRVLWFTTTGWMMWNFLVGVLLTEASIVLFDGSPGTPTLDRLWDLAAETGVTTFGTSASFIASCMKAGIEPGAHGRDLGAITAVGSTGSPLAPEGFQWIYDHVGEDTWLFSTSGGTDVVSAFVGGVPTLPVYRGELQARALGADVQAWDPEGRSLVGEVGELVIAQPMPSMPVFFWDDDDGTRLHDSYFDTYPGVWRHGDWIEITDRGTAIISGRSDSTINRGGIRMGTSEIYRAVLVDDVVVDALVVDVPGREGFSDGWMPLFVVLRDGAELTDHLIASIKRRVRQDCSPRHVPNEIVQIAEVPRTLTGKALEVPVKRILMGHAPEQVAARDALANPQALDAFVAMASRVTPPGPR